MERDPAVAPDQAYVGLHYKLSCYVCGPACTKPSPFEGWVTFEQIFTKRPDGCRFAVAQGVPLRRNTDPNPNTPLFYHEGPTGDFLVWDLFNDRLTRGVVPLRPPVPVWTGSTEDGLIMKAMALYGKA